MHGDEKMYVGVMWAEITRDRSGQLWLYIDKYCVARVLDRTKYTWEDSTGRTHKSSSFANMVRSAARIHNAVSDERIEMR